ncbi:MAG: aspartate carbamoyltransferase, partial [Candidatus Gracilibacteria bacterium]|nr:aspartate carbamoyltransferase [Candidatus Gracilibacteria bacterium]
HPTQHLLDFYTIWKNRGTLDGLTLGLMGDNKNSRVLRGMAKMATVFDIKLIFISPDELQPDEEVLSYLKKKGREYHQVTNIGEVIDQLDVLEINRVRHEYFEDKQRALEIGKQFILNTETVRKGKAELIVLDPLPRINTVQTDVDDLPQAKYFEAVENGVFVRMALMNQLMQR